MHNEVVPARPSVRRGYGPVPWVSVRNTGVAMTHISGPWKVTQNTLIETSDGVPFAGVYEDDDISEECQDATARLIAAAPELLEALKGLIETSQATPTEWVRACSNAAAAIAKAEGR